MYFYLLIVKQYVPSTVLIVYIYEVITYRPFERSLSADQEQAALCSLPADKLSIPGSDRPTRSTMNDSKYLATCVRLFSIQIRKDDGPGWNAGKKWGKGENLVEWGGGGQIERKTYFLLFCYCASTRMWAVQSQLACCWRTVVDACLLSDRFFWVSFHI